MAAAAASPRAAIGDTFEEFLMKVSRTIASIALCSAHVALDPLFFEAPLSCLSRKARSSLDGGAPEP